LHQSIVETAILENISITHGVESDGIACCSDVALQIAEHIAEVAGGNGDGCDVAITIIESNETVDNVVTSDSVRINAIN